MNGLVEKMLDLTADREAEVALLEGLFEEDCKCGSAHTDAIWRECTQTVVARCTTACDSRSVFWCQSALTSGQAAVDMGYHVCRHCGRKLAECWTINLI